MECDRGRRCVGGTNFPRFLFDRSSGELVNSCRQSDMERVLVQRHVRNLEICSTNPNHILNITQTEATDPVYGLEFCRNGGILLSAHGDGMVYGYDCRTQRKILHTVGGHTNCANGCTSIDNNYFASYSDDKTVLVWDLRNMTGAVKQCVGHNGWVKNVSILKDGKTLVTSGCDQTLRSYDISRPQPVLESSPLIFFDGLCRTKMHPTENTIYLTTFKTSVYAIHNLNVDFLEHDALNYCLSKHKHGKFKSAAKVRPFSQTRNMMDIVYFVPDDGTTLTSGQSLAVHPHGDCCAVRFCRQNPGPGFIPTNISFTEWISLYDLNVPNITPVQNESDEDNTHRVNQWRREYKFDSSSFRAQRRIWIKMMMTEKIEDDLVRNSNITRKRLNLLYDAWVKGSYDTSVGLVEPQLVKNATFYSRCETFSPGIIKEISFSPCGRLLLDPTRYGFRVLAFDDNLENYTRKTIENQEPKLLKTISEMSIGSIENCVCAKFVSNYLPGAVIVCGTLNGKILWCKMQDAMS